MGTEPPIQGKEREQYLQNKIEKKENSTYKIREIRKEAVLKKCRTVNNAEKKKDRSTINRERKDNQFKKVPNKEHKKQNSSKNIEQKEKKTK